MAFFQPAQQLRLSSEERSEEGSVFVLIDVPALGMKADPLLRSG